MRLATLKTLLSLMVVACTHSFSAADRARLLSQQELSTIYLRMNALRQTESVQNLPKDQWPAELARLEPEGVYLQGDSAWIHLGGSFDDKVYLFVNGLGEPQGHEIVLSSGEQALQEVLWRRSR